MGNCPAEKLILRFDWDLKTLGTRCSYGDHPYLSRGACEFLLQKGCRLLTVDTPQPDNPLHGSNSPIDAPIHKFLLAHDVLLLEYLVNLKDITAKETILFAAPLKVEEGDGAPAHCFVMLS